MLNRRCFEFSNQVSGTDVYVFIIDMAIRLYAPGAFVLCMSFSSSIPQPNQAISTAKAH